MQVRQNIFAEAVRRLRAVRGISQDGLARLLDVSKGAIQLWEAGDTDPGGGHLIKMLQLCPDADSLRAFGIDVDRLAGPGGGQVVKPAEEPGTKSHTTSRRLKRDVSFSRVPRSGAGRQNEGRQARADRYYNAGVLSLRILLEASEAGSDGAMEVLRHFAEELTQEAGKWRLPAV